MVFVKGPFPVLLPRLRNPWLEQVSCARPAAGETDYKRELKDRVLSRADAQRHFRRTGDVAGAHARANVVDGTEATALAKDRGRAIERGRYAPAIGGRSLSRGLSSSSASSAGSDAFAFVSDDDDTGAGNGNGAGH